MKDWRTQLRMAEEHGQIVRRTARLRGESVNALLTRAVLRELARDGMLPDDQCSALEVPAVGKGISAPVGKSLHSRSAGGGGER